MNTLEGGISSKENSCAKAYIFKMLKRLLAHLFLKQNSRFAFTVMPIYH